MTETILGYLSFVDIYIYFLMTFLCLLCFVSVLLYLFDDQNAEKA